jgi:hypothetical protein
MTDTPVPATGDKITIEVTAKHIRDGIRCSERTCPVARGLKDGVPEATSARMGKSNALVSQGSYRILLKSSPRENFRTFWYDLSGRMRPHSAQFTVLRRWEVSGGW